MSPSKISDVYFSGLPSAGLDSVLHEEAPGGVSSYTAVLFRGQSKGGSVWRSLASSGVTAFLSTLTACYNLVVFIWAREQAMPTQENGENAQLIMNNAEKLGFSLMFAYTNLNGVCSTNSPFRYNSYVAMS